MTAAYAIGEKKIHGSDSMLPWVLAAVSIDYGSSPHSTKKG